MQVHERHHELLTAIDASLDPAVAAVLHSRLDRLFGGGTSETSGVVADFVDQYVLDAHGVSDQLCARLIAEVGEDQATALTFALAFHEAERRRAAVLG